MEVRVDVLRIYKLCKMPINKVKKNRKSNGPKIDPCGTPLSSCTLKPHKEEGNMHHVDSVVPSLATASHSASSIFRACFDSRCML